MKTKTHRLRELSRPVPVALSTLGYRDFVSEPDWCRNLISTTSLLYHPGRNRVVCGLTGFDTDLMYEFDLETNTWHGMDYPAVSEPFEIKIHRSLVLAPDGSVYGATAGLHQEDQRTEAPGGRLFRYDFETRTYDFLGRPTPPDYIQTISVDHERGLIYGVSYPVLRFFVFDLHARETRRHQYVGSIPHIMAIDDRGCVWATWNARKHHLFKYDPDTDRMHFFQHGLPNALQGAGLMYPGAGPVDSMLNGGDGFLYVGMTTGDLVRLDPKTAETEYLGRPTPHRRLSAMEIGPDGRLFGVAGFWGECHLFAYDRARQTFEVLGPIRDSHDDTPLFIGHDMCFTPGGRLFIGETDTADRAGYLWECQIPADRFLTPTHQRPHWRHDGIAQRIGQKATKD